MQSHEYKIGDIVGVVGDAMYEFRIIDWHEEHEMYTARCINSKKGKIKVGTLCQVRPDQIVLKLS